MKNISHLSELSGGPSKQKISPLKFARTREIGRLNLTVKTKANMMAKPKKLLNPSGHRKYLRKGSEASHKHYRRRALVSHTQLNRTKTRESDSENFEESKEIISSHTNKVYDGVSRRIVFKPREIMIDSTQVLIIYIDGIICSVQNDP